MLMIHDLLEILQALPPGPIDKETLYNMLQNILYKSSLFCPKCGTMLNGKYCFSCGRRYEIVLKEKGE